MKKAGIVVDNYKVDRVKKELTAKGFTDFKVVPFTKDTTTIQVNVEEHELKEIQKICTLVELHFKRSN
jgi:hypothetical protein